jgi:hypothetical protein
MMKMSRFINPQPQYLLANGDIAAGGTLTFYETGTNTLLDIFSDVGQTIPLANPITLGSRGEVPNIFYSSSARCVFVDADGNQVFDLDPVGGSASGGAYEVWDSNIVYDQNDIVTGADGNPYISLAPQNEGNQPTLDPENNTFWARLAQLGEWNSTVSYAGNSLVIQDGTIFRSLISNNVGNSPITDDGTQWKSVADAVYTTYNNTGSGLIAVTAQAALDEIVNLINNLPSSVTYRGQLDVSGGDASLPANPQNGDLYVIAVTGTITVSQAGAAPTPTAVNVGEQVIYNGETGNWDLIAQVTQASSINYNNTNSGLSATNVQTAIDEVEGRVDAAESDITQNVNDITALEGRATSLEAFEAQAGSAYTEDVQTTPLDTTTDALMAVGAFGIGETSDLPTWPQTSLNNITGVGAGIYRTISGTTNTPDGSNSWVVWFSGRRVTAGVATSQILVKVGNPSDTAFYYRNSGGGTESNPTWSDWKRVWDGSQALDLRNVNIDTVNPTEFFYGAGSNNASPTLGDNPFPNNVSGFMGLSIKGFDESAGRYTAQIVIHESDVDTFKFRSSGGSATFSDWKTVYHSGNSVNPLDFGIGTGSAPTISDYNLLASNGIFTANNGTSNAPLGGNYAVIRASSFNPNNGFEIAGHCSSLDNQVNLFYRQEGSTSYTDWVEVYHSGNSVNPVDLGLGVNRLSKNLFGNDLNNLFADNSYNGAIVEVAVDTANRPTNLPNVNPSVAGLGHVIGRFIIFHTLYPSSTPEKTFQGFWNGSSIEWVEYFTSGNSVNPLDFGLGDDGLPEFNVNQTNKTGFYNEVATGRVNIVGVRASTRAASLSLTGNATGEVPSARISLYNPQTGQVFYDNNLKTGSLTRLTASSTISRTGQKTEIVFDSASNSVLTINSADYELNDEIIINKCRLAGQITINCDVNMFDPDNIPDTTQIMPNGSFGIIRLTKVTSVWRITVS